MTTTTRPAWLAIAGICDCGGVAATLLGRWEPGTEDPEHDEEVTATGEDWRTAITNVVQELHTRTQLPILARCTVVHPSDLQLSNAVSQHVYSLADAAPAGGTA